MRRKLADIVLLEEVRRRRDSRLLARTLALTEAARELARRCDPDLVALIEKVFGAGYLARREKALLDRAPKQTH